MKLLLAVLPLLSPLLAAPSFAQMRVAPTPGALAWSGPMSAAIAGAAPGALAGTAPVLMRLTTPSLDGTTPMLKSPELLNPLAEALAARGVTPEIFARMRDDVRIAALDGAAQAAEERLGMAVWRLVGDSHKGFPPERRFEMIRAAEEAAVTKIYLNDRTLEGLKILEDRVAQSKTARRKALRAFYLDLPRVISERTLEADPAAYVRVEEEEGGRARWRSADGAPGENFASAEEALAARADAVLAAPPGPWTAPQADLLLRAMDANMRAGTLSPSRWSRDTRAALLEAARASETPAPGPRSAADAIERNYESAYVSAKDPVLRRRMLAAVLPSWDNLERERAGRSRMLDLWATVLHDAGSLFAMAGALAALLTPTLWEGASAGWLAAGALFVPVPALFFFYMKTQAKSDSLGRDPAPALRQALNRAFPETIRR